MVVTDTGMGTEMGKIAHALTNAKEEQTPLQIKLGQLSKVLSFLVLGICAVIFLLDTVRAYPNITGEGLLSTFMVAVSLAVAAIPKACSGGDHCVVDRRYKNVRQSGHYPKADRSGDTGLHAGDLFG